MHVSGPNLDSKKWLENKVVRSTCHRKVAAMSRSNGQKHKGELKKNVA